MDVAGSSEKVDTWLPNYTVALRWRPKTASSERLIPLDKIIRRHVHPEQSNKLLRNVGNSTSPHGIISQNILIFNIAVKPSAVQHRSSKETTIPFEAIC
jgi:hypothetical protein